MGGGMDPPPAELWRLIFLLRRLLTLLQLDNPGVGLIGDLGENQQVVAAEAVRRLPLPFRVAVALRESDVVAGALSSLIFPNRGLDGADPNGCGGSLVCHLLFLLSVKGL